MRIERCTLQNRIRTLEAVRSMRHENDACCYGGAVGYVKPCFLVYVVELLLQINLKRREKELIRIFNDEVVNLYSVDVVSY